MRASSCRFKQLQGKGKIFIEKPSLGQGKIGGIDKSVSLIDLFHLASSHILNQLGPDLLCLSDYYSINMLKGFVREHADMSTSHDHGNPSFSKFFCDLVSPGRNRSLGRDTHQIYVLIEINLLMGFI